MRDLRDRDDKNYVSVGFWMFALFVMTIPVINLIMVIVWAFVGYNESRKNYFRAILAWFLVFILLMVALVLIAGWPQIHQDLEHLMHRNNRMQ